MSAGSLTQLIASGALDNYLTQNASFTFWKARYNKYTPFAIESISQPFSTVVNFGTEAQVVLNRSGDLIYWTYIRVTLPAIQACDAEVDKCLGSTAQFPTFMDNSCAPCKANDEEVLKEYMDADETLSQVSSATDRAKLLQSARAKWLKTVYKGASPLECCDEVDDCPDAYPELGNVWCHWVQAIGQYLVKQVKLIIGGSTVDTLTNEWMYLWEELTGRSGRRLSELIGKRYTRTQLVCDSRQQRILYIPVPFWYTLASGQALSLASLQFHGVSIHVEFARLTDCIVVSSGNVIVKNAASACCLTPNDLTAAIETSYVFLDNQERERFSTNSFEVLISQNQSFYYQTNNSSCRLQLNFNHPIMSMYWCVRRQCMERTNNWFNFSGIDGKDPLISAQLRLNNQSRFGEQNAVYLRLVQPYQHHSNVPDAYIYMYSFALTPESEAPSGTCNFSRIDHVELLLQLQSGLGKEQVTVMVFARNHNIVRFREGLAGLAFAN
jgi:hypothetical protein